MKTFSFYLDEKDVDRLDRVAGFFMISRSTCLQDALNLYLRTAEHDISIAEKYAQCPLEDSREQCMQDESQPVYPRMVYKRLYEKFLEGAEK